MSRTTFSGPVKSNNGFEGAITGNITGNVTGNVTGNLTGNVVATTVSATTASGTSANYVNFDAGSSGAAGSYDVFPSTAAKGKTTFVAADNAGNTTTTITNASQAGAVTYTIPDLGASGNFVLANAFQSMIDGVLMSTQKWVDVTVTAALLDGAGSVNVIAGVAGDQYKVRHIRLVGGGTNFAAGGDRLISLTDGTTVYTTIANADIESAPSATLDWGNAKVPFLTGVSDTATASAAALRFQYSGGTTDHSATGSIKFSVCIQKVA